MDGIINLYKEAGWTSFDCVAKLRRILGTKKIGHGGTLDPQVTGVLPIAVGKATRLLEYMEGSGKAYEGEMVIGFSTETEDAEGAIVDCQPVSSDLTAAEIDAAMGQFVGKIQQQPPMYSAVKIQGKRLYEYARAGQTIERPTREITIKEFVRTSDLTFYQAENTVSQCVKFSFRVACSKGTYVRTLAVDVAKSLGYPGHMSQLRRTMANGLKIEDSVSLTDVAAGKFELLPLTSALSYLTKVELSADQAEEARVGKFLALSDTTESTLAAIYQGELVAILERREELYKPKKVFI